MHVHCALCYCISTCLHVSIHFLLSNHPEVTFTFVILVFVKNDHKNNFVKVYFRAQNVRENALDRAPSNKYETLHVFQLNGARRVRAVVQFTLCLLSYPTNIFAKITFSRVTYFCSISIQVSTFYGPLFSFMK